MILKGQEGNSNQGVELPDFVITGIQNVNVPIMQKKIPELKSTLSEDFFEPSFSPEEFNLGDFSNPIRQKAELEINKQVYDGRLKLGAGRYSLPVGSLSYNKNFTNVLFMSKVWGSNIKEYIDKAGYNNSGILLNSYFFVSNKSKFLPGNVFSLSGKYFRDAYRFFGSSNPDFKRETHTGNADISLSNHSDDIFNYGLDFKGQIYLVNENDFQENLFHGRGFVKTDFSKFGLDASLYFKRQMLSNNISTNSSYNFITASANASFDLKETLFLKGGVVYSNQGGNTFFYPTGAVALRFNDFISLFGEFSPNVEFKTFYDFINENPYFKLGSRDNVFVKHNINLKAALKYQYYKYIEISGGFKFIRTNNFVYFEDDNQQGFFDLHTAGSVNQYVAFLELFFHPGPYGNFTVM